MECLRYEGPSLAVKGTEIAIRYHFHTIEGEDRYFTQGVGAAKLAANAIADDLVIKLKRDISLQRHLDSLMEAFDRGELSIDARPSVMRLREEIGARIASTLQNVISQCGEDVIHRCGDRIPSGTIYQYRGSVPAVLTHGALPVPVQVFAGEDGRLLHLYDVYPDAA